MAQINRASSRTASCFPTGVNVWSCTTRSSFACSQSGQLADLVEEGRAPVDLPQQAGFVADRAREGSLRMSEQDGLKQILGNRRAVDDQKRLRGAAAVAMDRAGHDLLARPAFPRDQNVRVGARDPVDDVEQLQHPRTVADDLRESLRQFPPLVVAARLARAGRSARVPSVRRMLDSRSR